MTMVEAGVDAVVELGLRRLRAHLAGTAVQIGVARGQWQIGELDYPYLMVRVSASAQTCAHGYVDLRIEISGYPNLGITACPWSAEENLPLPAGQRPTAGRAGTVFRTDWENGHALYHPCDRVAVGSHADWTREHVDELWDAEQGIAKFLRLIHTTLNEVDHAAAVDSD